MRENADTGSKADRRKSFWRVDRRTLIVLLLVVLGLLAALGHRMHWAYLPVGRGPAGPGVPRAAFEQTWLDGKVVLLGLGDSVTAGFGASEGLSYFDRLVANPPGEFEDMAGISLSAVIPDLRTWNMAISLTTSLDHRRRIESLRPFSSEVQGIVVITTGGNDLLHDYGRSPPVEGAMYGATLEQSQPWIDNFRERLDWMVTALAERFPGGCDIFIADIYDPSDGTGDVGMGLPDWPDGVATLAAYNQIIADCAAKYDFVHLVKMHDAFVGHGRACRKKRGEFYRPADPHYWYYGNVEDPNDRGYDAIRRLFLLEMIDVFAPQRGRASQ